MLSWVPGKILRVHEGYAGAPDEVLEAIVRFVTPHTRRATRLAARRIFLSFPVERYYEHPESVATVVVEREWDGERVPFCQSLALPS